MRFPELSMEPPEPVVFAYCARCGHEIYEGEGVVIKEGKVYHTDCEGVENGRYEIADRV